MSRGGYVRRHGDAPQLPHIVVYQTQNKAPAATSPTATARPAIITPRRLRG